MNRRALLVAASAGLALQLVMVVAGHFATASVKDIAFPVGGMAFSLIAGVAYARSARPGSGGAIAGGAIAGGLCAFIGIAVSVALKDAPATLLALGTVASTLAGAIGGALRRLVPMRLTAGDYVFCKPG
ncbi:MAG: hypothetical protein H0X27_09530 [Caulobacteraceae bacterium]|nr:hypothetical protein [Caulobacteraceae bacterium]